MDSTTTLKATTAVIVLAFSTDPVARWVNPDPDQYLTYFPAGVRAFGGRASEHGTGHNLSGFAGAALWLPSPAGRGGVGRGGGGQRAGEGAAS